MPKISLLAAGNMSKKAHGSFHENVTSLGQTHKHQPKNGSLETTNVEKQSSLQEKA